MPPLESGQLPDPAVERGIKDPLTGAEGEAGQDLLSFRKRPGEWAGARAERWRQNG